MTSAECIAALDEALTETGEDIILRRVSGTTNIDAVVRASVRPFSPEELVGGITQTDSRVVLSMTDIRHEGWPNQRITTTSPYDPDPQLPRAGDFCVIQGRTRRITFVKPIFVDRLIVRLELNVAG